MKKTQKGFVLPLLLIIAVLIIGGGVFYYYSKNKSSTQSQSTNSNAVFNDSDLKISYVRIPDSDNSVSTLNSINFIAKSDRDFLEKYFKNYSVTNLPPLNQSTTLLARYKDLLAILDSVIHKQYQCSFDMGDTCPLNSIRYISELAALRAVVLLEQKNFANAQSEAEGIVSVGKQITANADDPISLIPGWLSQKLGYEILNTIHQKQNSNYLTTDQKEQLITTLRQEHKTVLKFMYTRYAELVDYVVSSNNKPTSKILTSDEEEQIDTYRNEVNENINAWNPVETKKYFYDSYKIAISNVDLPCGTKFSSSTIDFGFDLKNKNDENYVGKKIYSSLYSPFDSLNQNRCNVEYLINSL